MVALGKTLAAGTLAFSTFATSMAPGLSGWNYSQHTGNNKDDKQHHASYDDDDWMGGHSEYMVRWNNDHEDDKGGQHWLMSARHDDRKDDHKGGDKHHYGYNDRHKMLDYNLNEASRTYYSAQTEDKVKNSYAVEAASYDTKEDSNKDYSYAGLGNRSGYNFKSSDLNRSQDMSYYREAADYEREAKTSVEASVANSAVIDNSAYFGGNRSASDSNTSIDHSAMITQSASFREAANFEVEAANVSSTSSATADDVSYGSGWGGNGTYGGFGGQSSSNATSADYFKASASSEVVSNSTSTYATSYSLDESQRQLDSGYGYGHRPW